MRCGFKKTQTKKLFFDHGVRGKPGEGGRGPRNAGKKEEPLGTENSLTLVGMKVDRPFEESRGQPPPE